jgi:4-hydroxyphenylacetate 3-monooxygenase
MVQAQETGATIDDEGVVWPCRAALYSMMSLQSEINPRLIDIARELSGSAMIMVPSSDRDFANPAAAEDLARFGVKKVEQSRECC